MSLLDLPESGGSGWTIATIVVAGIMLALFVVYIGDLIGYIFATAINGTSTAHKVFWEALNGTAPEVAYEGRAGNYTYVIYKPRSNNVFSSMMTYLLFFLPALVTVVSDPVYLSLLFATDMIIIAYEIEVV